MKDFSNILEQTGLYQFFYSATPDGLFLPLGMGQAVMIIVCLILMYLGIKKRFEPLLLVPIAVGG